MLHIGAHVLAWFWEIDGFRPFDQGSPLAVPPTEIEAWSRAVNEPIASWEFVALYAMDRARRNAMIAPLEAPKPRMSVAAFDALFG